jgi:hypothetical protein
MKSAAAEEFVRGAPSSGPRPDAMKPDIHGVRTHWIRGFMAF